MIVAILSMVVFAAAYGIKGGWLDKFAPIKDIRSTDKVMDRLLEGRVLAALIVAVFALATTFDPVQTVLIITAWLIAVSPSMGEEAGAIGRIGYWWGDYKDLKFTRSYGVKKAIQRGVLMGAAFTLAMGNAWIFIPALGLGFVVLHFVGQEIFYRIHKYDSWEYAELMIGALIGLCYGLAL